MSTSREEIEQETTRDLEEIWLPLLKTDGKWDEKKIRAELHDLVFIYNQISEVYMYITGGLLSKPMYYAGVIKQQFDDNISSAVQEEAAETVKMAFEDLKGKMKLTYDPTTKTSHYVIRKIDFDSILKEVI